MAVLVVILSAPTKEWRLVPRSLEDVAIQAHAIGQRVFLVRQRWKQNRRSAYFLSKKPAGPSVNGAERDAIL